MQYRTLGRTGIQVGEIGIGCEGFIGKTGEQVREMVDLMVAAGVNCIDLYTPNPQVRIGFGGRSHRGKTGEICSPGPHLLGVERRSIQTHPDSDRGKRGDG